MGNSEWLEVESKNAAWKDWQIIYLAKNASFLRLYGMTRWRWLAHFMAGMEIKQYKMVKGSLVGGAYNSILAGILLLKKLGDFKVTFVTDCKDTIYELRTALRGYVYTTYFYLNGETIVLLYGCLDVKHRRHKASGTGNMPVVRALRWQHVIGELPGVNYDVVLDGLFGASGSTKREVMEMRACACCAQPQSNHRPPFP